MREIVLDTETTGLVAKDGHRLIEIGACEMINHVITNKTFHFVASESTRSATKCITNKYLHSVTSAFACSATKCISNHPFHFVASAVARGAMKCITSKQFTSSRLKARAISSSKPSAWDPPALRWSA